MNLGLLKACILITINLMLIEESLEGLVPRKKIRIRYYPNNEDQKIYLEIKNSSVEGRFKNKKNLNKRSISRKIKSRNL